MDTYHVERRDRAEGERLLRQPVPDLEPDPIRAPAAVYDQATGAPLAVVARYEGDMGAVRRAFMAWPMSTTRRTLGINIRSAVFGNLSRRVHMKREGCRVCNGDAINPAAHRQILDAGRSMAGTLSGILPDRWEQDDRTAAAAIDPGWRIEGTPWTSGVLNLTSPIPYHYDRNNLPTWSAMIVARRHTRGGHLHIPEFGLTLECRDGDIVWFPGWHHVHGVTPIQATERDGYRYTAVYYTIAGIAACLPPDQEHARAQRVRSHREDDLLERQAISGLYGG